MKHLFTILFTLTILSCTTDTTSYTVTGLANGFEDDTQIIVYSFENNQPKSLDTLVIKNEKFSGKFLKTEEATIGYFNISKYNANLIFFPGNEDLKVTLYKDSLPSSYVSGSIQNDTYTEFSKKLRTFNVQKQTNMERFQAAKNQQDNALILQIQNENRKLVTRESSFKKEYISTNNNSVFSVMLLSEMVSKKEMNPAEALAIMDNFTPKIAASQFAIDLKNSIKDIKNTDVGGLAPQFNAPTPDDKMMSLQDAMGKYTIIDFWASWCRPCRAENPNVVAVYKKYHDKGLNIISVSLDKAGQKDRWIKAIADDKMDWYHVSNLQAWQDPIAREYGVRSIPATFLLDENGTIIAKNLRGPALGAKIASLLGQ